MYSEIRSSIWRSFSVNSITQGRYDRTWTNPQAAWFGHTGPLDVRIYPNTGSKRPGAPLVLRSELIGNRHLWHLLTEMFIPEQLYERLKRDNLGSGWRFEKQIVV